MLAHAIPLFYHFVWHFEGISFLHMHVLCPNACKLKCVNNSTVFKFFLTFDFSKEE